VDESVKNGVHVGIGFDVVETDKSRIIWCLVQIKGGGERVIDSIEENWSKSWIKEIFNVVERWISYFVPIG
jgi:azurin